MLSRYNRDAVCYPCQDARIIAGDDPPRHGVRDGRWLVLLERADLTRCILDAMAGRPAFTLLDVERALPAQASPALRGALQRLRRQGVIEPSGMLERRVVRTNTRLRIWRWVA